MNIQLIIATKEHVNTSTQLGGEGAPLKFKISMYSKGSEALSLFQDKENQT